MGVAKLPAWLLQQTAHDALRVVRAAYRGGRKLYDSIEMGVSWLKEHGIEGFNANEARDWLRSQLPPDQLTEARTKPEQPTEVTHELVSGLGKSLQGMQAAVAPQTIDDTSRYVGNLLRHFLGEKATEMGRAEHALGAGRKMFDRTPVSSRWEYDPAMPLPKNYQFIDAYEGGNTAGMSPEERSLAAELHRQNDAMLQRVQGLGTGALTKFYQNYFPHLWDDPKEAKRVFAQILRNRPLEGPKGFSAWRATRCRSDSSANGDRGISTRSST